ncbi:MAG: hypothetical protein E7633_04860 [Ruminococcaceae bacterium]|nr:hypothetical protein [Oscillospiraceae bacterium]
MKAVRLSEYGILPSTDITLKLFSLFEENKEDTEFIFENADYYFSPCDAQRVDFRISNSDVIPLRTLAVFLKNMKNCTLRGNGARLWLAGQMQVFTLDHCENVKLEGFTVNWKKPLVAEGRVMSKNGSEIDVFVDPELFPHRFENENIEFDTGNDEWYTFVKHIIVFEPNYLRTRRDVSDVAIKNITKIGDSLYRMSINGNADIRTGDLINMRHNARIHAGIFTEKCSDITIENVTFYSSGGLGCLSQFCHNMTYRGVHFLADKHLGRLVSSGRDDGMHITCNSGTVTITECTFHALMDDPINVHGCCVTSDEVIDDRTLRCKYRHHQACGFLYWAEAGDEISFISRDTMESIGTSRVISYTLEDHMTFILKFDKSLPKEILEKASIGNSLALDNLTHTASFICTKNRFGSCRARGVLISTPKPVRICDNYFESSGSAILVAGDSNYWFESGECHDVEISRNVFTDTCLSSIYQFCDGIISISPVVPKPDMNKPFHKNIKITDNIFDTVGVPVLCAFSCADLDFSNNKIFKSESISYEIEHKPAIKISYCNNANISNNNWIGNFDLIELSENNCQNTNSDI